jgi:hypothetical protein
MEAMEAPTAQAPTAQDIEQNLYDLAFDDFYERLEGQFTIWDEIHSQAFQNAENCLTAAYVQWADHNDALGALNYLENASVICKQRLRPAYLSKYNESVSYLTTETSRAGTPVHSPVYGQGAHMRNLLLRVTACLH